MLILGRKEGESIRVDGPCEIVLVKGPRVQIGIVAERSVAVVRAELLEGKEKLERESDRD